MTAPLVLVKDRKRRKNSSTVLKPMTATGDPTRSNLSTRGQLFTDSHWIPDSSASHEGSQNSSERGASLSLSLSTCDPLPPTPLCLKPPHILSALAVCSEALSSLSSWRQLMKAHCRPLYLSILAWWSGSESTAPDYRGHHSFHTTCGSN